MAEQLMFFGDEEIEFIWLGLPSKAVSEVEQLFAKLLIHVIQEGEEDEQER